MPVSSSPIYWVKSDIFMEEYALQISCIVSSLKVLSVCSIRGETGSDHSFYINNIHFRLRFGLVNTINTYLRLKINVARGGISTLNV